MLRFCSLYSGSTGNSYLVQSSSTNILVDAGVSAKKIETALNDLNINVNTISGIIITHEHSDHTAGLSVLSNKYNLPIYIRELTWNAMPKQTAKINKNNKHFFTSPFYIGDLYIEPFDIPHDAADPCGFNIYCDNKKISIATDIGHITENILNHLEKSSFVLLESNYDKEVLKCSSYPFYLKNRINGPLGHLSNTDCGHTISHLMNHGLNTVMLGHLSKENNFPELAYQTVYNEINTSNAINNINILVANRDIHTNFIDI